MRRPASRPTNRGIRLLVVGDALLDRDVLGTAERLCPDAAVPVVDEHSVEERPGGAGLAALLAARTGADVTLLCAMADDPAAERLRALLQRARVHVLACADSGTTCEKTRVRVGGHSVVRIDRGRTGAFGAPPRRARDVVRSAEVVLVADYGRGLLASEPVRALVAEAIARGIPTVWDPHPRGATPLPGVTLAVPNAAEAARFTGEQNAAPSGSKLAAVTAQARHLQTRWNARAVAVTLGAQGAAVAFGDGAPLVVPVADPVVGGDVCGAGDAFAAAAALRLGDRAVVSEAVTDAVATAARFVAAGGAGGLGLSERVAVSALESHGTLVAAGGCFDVLHAGHVATLEAARALGDRLVVLLNGDRSVRRLKGPGRPVQRAVDREAVLRSLRCVDDVVVFDDDTPIPALRQLQPAVFVKGGDYTAAELPETAVLAEWGGVVVTAPYLAGRSTSRLIHDLGRIRDAS